MADISTPLKHFSDAVLSNEAMARKRDLGEIKSIPQDRRENERKCSKKILYRGQTKGVISRLTAKTNRFDSDGSNKNG